MFQDASEQLADQGRRFIGDAENGTHGGAVLPLARGEVERKAQRRAERHERRVLQLPREGTAGIDDDPEALAHGLQPEVGIGVDERAGRNSGRGERPQDPIGKPARVAAGGDQDRLVGQIFEAELVRSASR